MPCPRRRRYSISTTASSVLGPKPLSSSRSLPTRSPRPGSARQRSIASRPSHGPIVMKRLGAGGYADSAAGAHCASAGSPSGMPSGVGTPGVSRRYHSASSAAWQPDAAAVIAWR